METVNKNIRKPTVAQNYNIKEYKTMCVDQNIRTCYKLMLLCLSDFFVYSKINFIVIE